MQASSHNVLVTGGAKGIGFALARKFHAAGNRVTIAGRDRGALDAAASQMAGARTIVADVATAVGRDRLVAEASDTTVLINNAGIQFTGAFSECLGESIDQEVDTNLLAPMHLVRRFIPLLSTHAESAIVNITSILAIVPKQSAPVYCATKAALRSFTRSLRWQLAGTPLRVFEVLPPIVDTAMTAGRGKDKIPPEVVAEEVWRAYLADTPEIYVGKARAVSVLARIAPSVVERVLRQS